MASFFKLTVRSWSSRLAGVAVVLWCATTIPQGAIAEQEVRLNRVIERLAQGQHAGLSVGEAAFIDLEHGSYELDRLETTLEELAKKKNAKGQLEQAPLVRIPMDGDEPFRWIVKQVLELGAYGIVFPNIETKADAIRAVRAMRFAPQKGAKHPEPRGERHVTPVKAAKYWQMPMAEYLRRADVWPLNPEGELLAILMIESPEGVKNINEIASVPGVTILIGHNDLSMRLGLGLAMGLSTTLTPTEQTPGFPQELEDAIQTVLRGCLANRVPCGIAAGPRDGVLMKKRIAEGFRLFLG